MAKTQGMKQGERRVKGTSERRVTAKASPPARKVQVVTLGDLIAAAFDVPGDAKAAAKLVSSKAMAKATARSSVVPEIPGNYRMGDIRHCFADVGLARRTLGYEAQVPFADGLAELAEWLQGQMAHDRVAEARAELQSRGLTL